MNVQHILQNQKARGALFIDTNILILFVVGACNPLLLSKSKRTATFSTNDLELLVRFSQLFQTIRTTPPVLSEVCNLLDTLNREQGGAVFASLAAQLRSLRERHVPAVTLAGEPAFMRIGLADTSLLSAARSGAVILSDDLKFCSEVWSCGLFAVNFNHLRSELWFGRGE